MKKPTLFAIVAIVIILAGTVYMSVSLSREPQIDFTAVKKADVTLGLKENGVVSAAQDLSLSFQQGGTVAAVYVKAGDSVKQGQALVRLDAKSSAASLNQAQAAVDSAQANLLKVQNGATGADVDVAKAAVDTAQTALDNAQKTQTQTQSQQNQNVKNALNALLNSNLAAVAGTNNISTVAPTISGAYTGATQGQYQIKAYSTGSGMHFTVSGLETYDGVVSTASVPLGTMGLFIQFPSNVSPGDVWMVNIPNTQGANYVANYNAYQSSLQTQTQMQIQAQSAVDTAQSQLAQAQAALELKETAARPEDISAAKAQLDTAYAMLQSAQNNYSNNSITAPVDGTITSVDTKVGQTVAGSSLAPGPDAVKMISSGKFQITVPVSETDISKIKVGDGAQVTLDAYGSGTNFDAKIITIDPSSSSQNGMSAYTTTLEFTNDDSRIKEGMGANITITDESDGNQLVVPVSSVIQNGNQDIVLVKNSAGQIVQNNITAGKTGLDGNVEILSGLSEGQMVAVFNNN